MRFLSYKIVILFLFVSIRVNAQMKKEHNIFHIGIKSSSVYGDNVPLKDFSSFKPVIDFGFGINYVINKNIRFQPEIHYNPRGYQAKYNFTDSTFVERSLQLHYIDFCPNFNYTFGNQQNPLTRLSVWGGPYVGVGILGKNVYSGTLLNKSKTKADSTFSDVTATFGNGLNRIDYGFNVGVGLQLERFTQIGFSYNMGFNNVSDDKMFNYYNKSWGFYIRVLFDDML